MCNLDADYPPRMWVLYKNIQPTRTPEAVNPTTFRKHANHSLMNLSWSDPIRHQQLGYWTLTFFVHTMHLIRQAGNVTAKHLPRVVNLFLLNNPTYTTGRLIFTRIVLIFHFLLTLPLFY